MKGQTVASFFDELQKIAQGGGAAALGTEVLGLPGGMIGGYREGGARGLAGAGLGGGAGLAAGVGVRHLLKRYVTGGEFGRRHPIAATAIESLPLAIGSTLGGAVGSQLLKRAGVEKKAMGLEQLVKLEQLAGKETVKDIMESMARQSGQLGKKYTTFKPRTLVIRPSGVQRLPHPQVPPPTPGV